MVLHKLSFSFFAQGNRFINIFIRHDRTHRTKCFYIMRFFCSEKVFHSLIRMGEIKAPFFASASITSTLSKLP